MTPAIPCFAGNSTLVATLTFSSKKEIQLTKYRVSAKCLETILSPRRLQLPQTLSRRLLQKYTSVYGLKHGSRVPLIAAVRADVTTEETSPAVSGEDADRSSNSPLASSGADETSSAASSPNSSAAQSKRTRPVRKSDMPPVKNEELVPGASFTGKVRSIQPFGAFVDFGAFTDGLVHVSRLSDVFVKDVASVVSVGQKVNIRLVEANMETGRISLTMRDSDDINKLQKKEAPSNDTSDKPRNVRKNVARSNQKRDMVQKSTKLVKGQALSGTVKNMTRSGAFVSLPEGEEGFLPISEESEGFGNILGSSSLQVGQEVDVRVLRIARGQVTLTMKKEEDVEGINKKLNQGVVHTPTNPFELAFRRNKDIAAYLEERERVQKSADSSDFRKDPDLTDEKAIETIDSDSVEVEKSTVSSTNDVLSIPSTDDEITSTVDLPAENSNTSIPKEVVSSTTSVIEEVSITEEVEESEASTINAEEDDRSKVNLALDEASKIVEENKESSAGKIMQEAAQPLAALVLDGNGSSVTSGMESVPLMDGIMVMETSTETAEENETASVPESSVVDETSAIVEAKEKQDASRTMYKTEESSETLVSEGNGTAVDEVGGVKETSTETNPTGQIVVDPVEMINNHSEDGLASDKLESEAPLFDDNELAPSVSENVKGAVVTDVEQAASSDPEKNGNATSNGQNSVPRQENTTRATISPSLVKQLREETGAGMMDCKKALAETGGDIIKAQEFLRKKGLASADKKANRATAEGGIGSYIHDNRIGVLIEVNCETDFVSRGEIFRQLVDDLAMQVAASPQVRYLVTEDVPEEVVEKERGIELQKEDLLTKPEQIRSKIVEGRIRKRLEEFALLEQPYIKNDKVVIKDWIKQTIATIGENIKVKRFVRYNLGEGLQKKSRDFAAEVAAQAAAKPSDAVPKDQSTAAKEPIDEPPTVTVSAALVKQLREETGAGMMDCKKALIETGGDLVKAQEYLRKKGLSSADKKSSRLAAEGRISSYIHDSRIGVLIEVNCETDFVGRNERFRELVDDLAMQVAACPQVKFVSVEEIPENIVSKEREIEMQREDLQSKPDNIKEKIVEGRISKRLGELALLEQPFIKDDKLLVKDLVKQTVAALGENIRVRRFERFTLGENEDHTQ